MLTFISLILTGPATSLFFSNWLGQRGRQEQKYDAFKYAPCSVHLVFLLLKLCDSARFAIQISERNNKAAINLGLKILKDNITQRQKGLRISMHFF